MLFLNCIRVSITAGSGRYVCTLEELPELPKQFSCKLRSRLAENSLIARWKTHLAAMSDPRVREALCFVIISCQCITSSLAPHLDTGAKISRRGAVVDNSHHLSGIYLSGRNEHCEVLRLCAQGASIAGDPILKNTLNLAACLLWLLQFLVTFLLPSCLYPTGINAAGDGNHHKCMQEHSSLVHVHGSQQNGCLQYDHSKTIFRGTRRAH